MNLLRTATCLIIVSVTSILLWQTADVSAEPVCLQADTDHHWYKGNLHTHSLWSDGDNYLESIAAWYREHDYHFVSFTDHNILADRERWISIDNNKGGRIAFEKMLEIFPEWVETRGAEAEQEVRLRTFAEVAERFNKPGQFLLIQGEEISDRFEKLPIHLNAHHVQEILPPRGGNSVAEVIQNNVNALWKQREQSGQTMMIHLNHPNFGYAVTADDLARIVGENFFEVYNGHPGVHNKGDETHASTEEIWDHVLTQRLTRWELPLMYGLATDDGHNYHNIPSRASEPGRGWVMVLANELTAESLIDALERGDFYSSSGVTLKSILVDHQSYQVEIEPVENTRYTIEFVGTRPNVAADTEGTAWEPGVVLETFHSLSARYEFQGDELYVRARITADTLHPNPSELHDHQMAWTQPVIPGKLGTEQPVDQELQLDEPEADERTGIENWPAEIVIDLGDLQTRLESRSFWTLYRIDFQGRRLGLDRFGSYYGSVASFPGIGFIGSGHTENEDEQILDLQLFVDGKQIQQPSTPLTAKSVRLLKRSRLRSLSLNTEIEMTGSSITETVTLQADEESPVKSVYHAMHPWTPAFSDYAAETARGELISGKFNGDRTMKISQPVRWSALYQPEWKMGAVTVMVEAPSAEEDNWQTWYWDIDDRYRKHYLATFVNQTIPANKTYRYQLVTIPFTVTDENWIDLARQLTKKYLD